MHEDKLTNEEIDRLIELLQKWKTDDLTWGEVVELRDFGYSFSDKSKMYFTNY